MKSENTETGLSPSCEDEIDISEFVKHGRDVPHARVYRVPVDGHIVRIDHPNPDGKYILGLVKKRPCAYELIEEFVHHKNNIVEPDEKVDLRKKGLKGYITAHKEKVTISINGKPFEIQRGSRTVEELLDKVGQTPDAYMLLEEKDGALVPLAQNLRVKVHGCEVFHSQVQSGGSS